MDYYIVCHNAIEYLVSYKFVRFWIYFSISYLSHVTLKPLTNLSSLLYEDLGVLQGYVECIPFRQGRSGIGLHKRSSSTLLECTLCETFKTKAAYRIKTHLQNYKLICCVKPSFACECKCSLSRIRSVFASPYSGLNSK